MCLGLAGSLSPTTGPPEFPNTAPDATKTELRGWLEWSVPCGVGSVLTTPKTRELANQELHLPQHLQTFAPKPKTEIYSGVGAGEGGRRVRQESKDVGITGM